MQGKSIHIVFQVLNFLQSSACDSYDLTDGERLVLINLASHNGPRGICPSNATIAKETGRNLRNTEKILASLRKKCLITNTSIKNINSQYTFLFLTKDSTVVEDGMYNTPPPSQKTGHPVAEDGSPPSQKTVDITNKQQSKQRERDATKSAPSRSHVLSVLKNYTPSDDILGKLQAACESADMDYHYELNKLKRTGEMAIELGRYAEWSTQNLINLQFRDQISKLLNYKRRQTR